MLKYIMVLVLLNGCKPSKENVYYDVATYKTDSGEKLYSCSRTSEWSSTVNYLKICTDLKECNDYCQEMRNAK